MTGFTDHQAAARAGVDQSARQAGYPLFPSGWDAMDADRHHVPCSGDWSPLRSSWGYWRITCMDCGALLARLTKRELREAMAEHLDG